MVFFMSKPICGLMSTTTKAYNLFFSFNNVFMWSYQVEEYENNDYNFNFAGFRWLSTQKS